MDLLSCHYINQMEIIKRFKDGSMMVSDGKSWSIVNPSFVTYFVCNTFDIKGTIKEKLSSNFLHCKFSFVDNDIYMDNKKIASLSIDSILDEIKEESFSDYYQISSYLDETIMPPLFKEVLEEEHRRCAESIEYFTKNYSKQISK